MIAYQVIWDYLDSVHEQQPKFNNGVQLHQALSDSYKLDHPLSDHYAYHIANDDGEYLRALTCTCRENASRLVSYLFVQRMLMRAAHRSALALSINHEADPVLRRAQLKLWASRQPTNTAVTWFEMAAAGAAALDMYALLAEATNVCEIDALPLISSAYSPWICSVATMLDSYADQVADEATGEHVYVSYYPTPEAGVKRTGDLIHQSFICIRSLPRGPAHAVILASMVAMYLTRNSARIADRQDCTEEILLASGRLTRTLVPVLRTWRTLYGLRSS